jgi:two-component system phosphate regulon response regulator PhoB
VNGDRPKVMLVEDEEQLRLLLRLTLDLGSVDIIEAEDGETAVEKARLEAPDVIFLDWALPGMTGIDVCRELRAGNDPATKDTRIVMLTGHSGDHERRQGLDAGADDYLTKPFSPQQLLDKLSELLGPRNLLGSA